MESRDPPALYRRDVAEPPERVRRSEDGGTKRARAAAAPAIAAIVAGAAVVAALIGVGGDFPLSDDWSYAYAMRSLCETGTLRLLPWTGASLVFQAWYGAALCRMFGFSFTVLRMSTVVLATAGAIGFHLLLRRLGVRGAALSVATAVFALDPLYVNLGFTFMTDVPFTVAAVWAGYWYLRGLEERRDALLVVGALTAAAALLIRQHGILVAGAASMAVLLAREWPWRARLRGVLAAGLVPGAVFAAYHVWLFTVHGAPSGYENKLSEARHLTATAIVNCTFRGLAYCGLLLAPLAAMLVSSLRRHAVLAAAWTVALGTAAVALYLREGALMFYLTNVLYDFGVGPLSLRDTHVLGMAPPTRLGLALRLPLTGIAVLSAAALCTAISAAIAEQVSAWRLGASARGNSGTEASRHPVGVPSTPDRSVGAAFLLLAALLLFGGTLLQARYYFDRYLIAVLPFAAAAALAAVPARASRLPSIVLAGALAWLAVAGTHDYLAWNRARFAGLAELTRAAVPPTEIDGGFEFNAWHLAATYGHWPSDAEVRVGQTADHRSWWWVVDDRYVLSFHELSGYGIRSAIPYTRWLVPGRGRVLVLERLGPR